MQNRLRSNREEQNRLQRKSAFKSITPSKTRQEKGPEANINNIMKTFGVNTPQRQGVYGQTVDYNMDLASASSIVGEALEAYQKLPDKLKSRYRTLDEFRKGMESGTIKPADLMDERQLQLALQQEQEREHKERKEKTHDGNDPDDTETLRNRNKSTVDKEDKTK